MMMGNVGVNPILMVLGMFVFWALVIAAGILIARKVVGPRPERLGLPPSTSKEKKFERSDQQKSA